MEGEKKRETILTSPFPRGGRKTFVLLVVSPGRGEEKKEEKERKGIRTGEEDLMFFRTSFKFRKEGGGGGERGGLANWSASFLFPVSATRDVRRGSGKGKRGEGGERGERKALVGRSPLAENEGRGRKAGKFTCVVEWPVHRWIWGKGKKGRGKGRGGKKP